MAALPREGGLQGLDDGPALTERLREARAAAETIAEGDPTAVAELDAEIDGMAQDIAALKGITATSLG